MTFLNQPHASCDVSSNDRRPGRSSLAASLGATACVTAAGIVAQANLLTLETALTAAGAAALFTVGGALTGLLGNRLTRQLNNRLTEPRELLSNSSLHRLCGKVMAGLIEEAAAEAVSRDAMDDYRLLEALAEGTREDWSSLTEFPGRKEQLGQLSRESVAEAMRTGESTGRNRRRRTMRPGWV